VHWQNGPVILVMVLILELANMRRFFGGYVAECAGGIDPGMMNEPEVEP
jgi:hypothetical protein